MPYYQAYEISSLTISQFGLVQDYKTLVQLQYQSQKTW